MPYSDYLKTAHWKKTRQHILTKRKGRCMMCRSAYRLQVHHRRYKDKLGNILFRESDHELYLLCDSCHATWHNYHGYYVMKMKHIQRVKTLLSLGATRTDAIKIVVNGLLYRSIINAYKTRMKIKRTDRLPHERVLTTKPDDRASVSP